MSKRQIYRHPVTNKFISKKEWESLQPKEEVKDGTQLVGSDFDVDPKYIEDTEKFMKSIEEDFDNIVKTITEDKIEVKEEIKEEIDPRYKRNRCAIISNANKRGTTIKIENLKIYNIKKSRWSICIKKYLSNYICGLFCTRDRI